MTAPFSELHVVLNAATSVSGEVTVELLRGDASSTVLATSLAFVGDSVDATVYFNASYIDPATFTCNNENSPPNMPSANDIKLVADVSPFIRAAGSSGLRLRVSMVDARLWSVMFVEVPAA